ncbi:hypothetical protein SAMN05444392_10649 [Seinonella peptonophila]|uniref:ArsR family transcriptional regulator n=1 Tax=Seinonella peptonophila TaxID=112248 RepID=A0A1M4Y5G0_9BACL|nr:ArsR family transcriptional regulator [Seinonella peptonophila]SHF00856.1 hypothetical protein SAMN05444392_10649 [Seinonella peptonophila]
MFSKRSFLFTTWAIGFLLVAAACTNSTHDMSKMDHSKMKMGDMNEEAAQNRITPQTKNVSRINTDDPVEIAVETSQMVWPATSTENRPATVLIGITGNGSVNLPAVKLIHHPNNGPLLYAKKDQLPKMTKSELQRLKPIGSPMNNQVQVILLGNFDQKLKKEVESMGYKVDLIAGNEPMEMAKNVDAYYAKASGGKLPAGVIIGSLEANDYTVPAANWIAHMPEALLYVKKNEIPQATIEALKGRNGKANIYLLGPEAVISKDVEAKLQQYGKVVRIEGNTPEENAIAFAKYKDAATGFGWGVTEPGHGFVINRLTNLSAILPTTAFAHLGKHAPMLVMKGSEMTPALHEYLMNLQPKFKDDPTIGPYNHAYMIGTEKSFPFATQGMIDQMLEITSENGEGHAGH